MRLALAFAQLQHFLDLILDLLAGEISDLRVLDLRGTVERWFGVPFRTPSASLSQPRVA
jgi:hypothetical protein